MANTDEKVDLVKALSVFQHICDNGEKLAAGHYLLEGLQAQHDPDGYTLVLCDKDVQLTLFFHNKYQAQFQKRSQFEGFLNKLNLIYQNLHP